MPSDILQDEHQKRRLKVLQSTSASQISTFELCQRKWANGYVFGIWPDKKPSQVRGTIVDDLFVQRYLRTGVLPKDVSWEEALPLLAADPKGGWQVRKLLEDGELHKEVLESFEKLPRPASILEALIPHLPKPGPRSKLVVQAEVFVPTFDGGPILHGFADWIEHGAGLLGGPFVGDLKTTYDFKYCKSDAELSDDTQLLAYARHAYENLGANEVTVGHVYARVAKKRPARAHASTRPHPFGSNEKECKCAACKAWLSNVNRGKPQRPILVHMPRDVVEVLWARRVETVKVMVHAARTARTAEELAPNTDACGAFGGCHYREKCGFKKEWEGFEMGNGSNDLIARLNAAKAAKAGQPTPPAAQETKAPLEEAPPKEVTSTTKEVDLVEAARAAVAAKSIHLANGGKIFAKDGADQGWIMRDPTDAERVALGMPAAEAKAEPPLPPMSRPENVVQMRPDAVLPPDAPSRTSTLEEVEAASAPKAKKMPAKKQKEALLPIAEEIELVQQSVAASTLVAPLANAVKKEVQAMQEKKLPPAALETSAKLKAELEKSPSLADKVRALRKAPKHPPHVYVDCIPTKDLGTIEPVSLEDWLGPIVEQAAEAAGVSDLRLVPYGGGKGVLATAIREALDTCPAALLIDGSQFGADEVLAALVPHAALVVRGVR